MLMAFMLIGAGKSLAQDVIPYPPPSSYTFSGRVYTFTPAVDGYLTMTGRFDADGEVWGKTWSGSGTPKNWLKPMSKAGSVSSGYIWTWQMEGNTTYYFCGTYNGGTFTDIKYTPIGGGDDEYPIIDPESGKLTTNYKGTTFEYASGANIAVLNENSIYLTNPYGGYKVENFTVANGTLLVKVDGNKLVVTINPASENYADGGLKNPIPVEATIQLVIPAGTFTVDGTKNDIITLDYTIPAGEGTMPTLPACNFLLPKEQNLDQVPGLAFIWGEYEDKEWNELKWYDPSAAQHSLTVAVPGFDQPFTYYFNKDVDKNDPNDDGGTTDSSDGSGNYPNTISVRRFMYSEGDVWGTWAKAGDYKITIPAKTVYVLVDGVWLPNEEVNLVYHCTGNGGGYLEEARIVTPVLNEEGETYEVSNVVIQFPTAMDNEGYSLGLKQLAQTLPVEVTILNNEGLEVANETLYAVMSPTNKSAIEVDLSKFDSQLGTYELSIPAGLVGQAALPYMDELVNQAQNFTFFVVEPVIAKGTYTGTFKQGDKSYPYTFDYTIEYNEDGTLTTTAKYTWADGVPTGYTGNVVAQVPGKDPWYGSDNGEPFTSTVTFTEDEEVVIDFFVAAADGGQVLVPVTYTVGTKISSTPQPEPSVQLPEPVIRNNALYYPGGGYFDGFYINWWKEVNVEPYAPISIVDASGIKVKKNGVQLDPDDWYTTLVPWQEDEDTPEFDNATLQVSANMIEMDMGKTYTLYIPAGAVNVMVDGQAVPNKEINYSFVLEDKKVEVNVPDPTVNPKEGEVEALETVQLSWEGFEVQRLSDNEGGFMKNITLSINGGEAQNIETSYLGSESEAHAGYYPTLVLNVNAKVSGEYVITIPEGALYLTNEEAGSVENEKEITLTYTVNIPSAPEYIDVAAQANPRPGVVASIGNVQIFWPDVKLEGCSRQPVILTPEQANKMFTITLNDNPVTIGNTYSAGRIVLQTVVITDEETGQEIGDWDALTINWPEGYFYWKGDLSITLNEGTVKAADGKVNETAKFVYNIAEVMNNTWEPAQEADGSETFIFGENNVIYAVWDVKNDISLVQNPEIPIFYQKYDEASDKGISGQLPADEFLSVENNKLKFNITSFTPGRYLFVIPENTVTLGEGYVNGESQYNFTVEVDNNMYVGVSNQSVPEQYDTNKVLTTDDNGKTYSGTVIIEQGQNFNFWWNPMAMQMDLKDGLTSGFMPLGPASEKEEVITFSNSMSEIITNLTMTTDGYWKLGNDEPLELTFTIDMEQRKLTIVNNTEIEESAPEFISVAIGANYLSFPAQKEDDVKLLPSAEDPNVYEGTIQIGKMKAFAFYTPDGTSYTATSTSNYCSLSWAFGSNQYEWPSDYDANIAKSHLSQNNSVRMYFGSFTDYPNSATTADVTIRVNWEEQTFAMTLAPYVAPAPEELYLWGTTGGFTAQARTTNMATFTKATDANVYTLENFEVPACGIFVPDGEFKAPNGAPNYGFYFFLNDSKTSMTSGTRYLAPTAASEADPNPAIIDLTASNNTYTVTAVPHTAGGGNFIALTPGLYNFTFNFDTKQFTAVLAEEYNQVTFKFAGEGLEKNPYTYVKAMSMFDGKELKFVDPEYLYSYNQQAGVSFAAIEGYQLKITCANAQPGEGVYSINSQNTDGTINTVLGLYPGANDFVFTITVSEIPEEPSLYFDDFTMEFTKGSVEAVTVTVPVGLDIADPFEYQGFQFDITLPLNLKATEVAINSDINLGDNGTAKVVPYTKDVPANTYRVIAYFGTGTAITDDIATLTISGVYSDQMIDEEDYDVTIQNTVIFSTTDGSDITNVNGYTGSVTILITRIPAEEITFDKVELAAPSFTDQEGNITEVTQGESVTMTITISPEDTTDELEVTADNGAVVTRNEDGTWNVDTSNVEVAEGEEVTVTVTAKAGQVEETYELTVKGVLLGDSNDNGKVTVADVVTTANYIAGNEIDNFCFPNANVILNEVDGEQVINVQDVTATVEIVLSTFDGNQYPQQNIRRQANRVVSNDRLVASSFNAGQSTIAVDLESTSAYAALQATIELPAGMKVESVSVGQRAAGHELVYNVTGNELHVVLFSYTNDSFGNEGSLFNITVKAEENSDDLVIKNILASDANSNGYELSYEGGIYSDVTAIDGISAEEAGVRYFTVDGVEVIRPEAGQILIRVAGNEVTKVLVK